MKSKIAFFLIIFFLLVKSLSALDLDNNENLDQVDLNKYFKYETYEESISCIKPYIIEGIDKTYVVENGVLLYIVELYGSKGQCDYNSQKLVFRKNTSQDIISKVMEEFKPKINMNLDFKLKFKVRRVAANANILIKRKEITIPYFVVLSDRLNNNIIKQKDYKITIPLTYHKDKIVEAETIFMEESFDLDNFVNMEILTGMYFDKPLL